MKNSSIFLLVLVLLWIFSIGAAADGSQRTIKYCNVHTKECGKIVYGKSDINHIMRDWRRPDPNLKFSDKTLEFLWDVMEQVGTDKTVHILSAHRTPKTNKQVGGASRSQHLHGKALDFRVEGVSSRTLYKIATGLQRGGVGYYPTFIHIDSGPIRTWGTIIKD